MNDEYKRPVCNLCVQLFNKEFSCQACPIFNCCPQLVVENEITETYDKIDRSMSNALLKAIKLMPKAIKIAEDFKKHEMR